MLSSVQCLTSTDAALNRNLAVGADGLAAAAAAAAPAAVFGDDGDGDEDDDEEDIAWSEVMVEVQ